MGRGLVRSLKVETAETEPRLKGAMNSSFHTESDCNGRKRARFNHVGTAHKLESEEG